jgi:dipeptidyl-peptidase-4
VNTQVDKLENDLLVIHGAQDPTVVWQHSLRFVRECIKNEVLIDYFVYPTHEHNVRGKDRVHLFEKITDFIQDTL